jgi:nucleotide-binding universal stress UspA family protein
MMTGTARIVVGFDGSPAAGAAVDWAAAEAVRRDLSLTVVHTVELPDAVAEATGGLGAAAARVAAAAEAITEHGVERARKTAGTHLITSLTGRGSAAKLLVEASRTARLVVVGTRAWGEVPASLLGSTAFAVTAHAHCPVVVVRGSADELPGPRRPVVVGEDGTPESLVALRYAAAAAASAGAPLRVVTAWRPGLIDAWALTAEPGANHDLDLNEVVRRVAVETARDGANLVREAHPHLEVTSYAAPGPPVPVLCDVASGAGLLVVGSHARGGVASLVLGSVSRGAICSAPCPVAVVRPFVRAAAR